MKYLYSFAALTALLFALTLPLHAQSGCDDSPENPTAILALVGGAGVGIAYVRDRFRARRDK